MKPQTLKKALQLAALMAVTGFHSGIVQAVTYPYVYEWRDFNNPNDSFPPFYSGKLFLDAPSSSHGSLSDVGPGSYIQMPTAGGQEQIRFMLSPFTPSLIDPVFTWNSAGITEMFISFDGFVGPDPASGYLIQNENFNFANNDIEYNETLIFNGSVEEGVPKVFVSCSDKGCYADTSGVS